jgi:DNA-binding NtrC family response regulator
LPHQILVVDDDEAIRVMLARLLESQGYVARQARGASEARTLVSDDQFDLMIVDVVMPGESGLEFAAYVREREGKAPIILISGYATDEPESFAKNNDGVLFVSKPFGADQLLGLVRTVLEDPAA